MARGSLCRHKSRPCGRRKDPSVRRRRVDRGRGRSTCRWRR